MYIVWDRIIQIVYNFFPCFACKRDFLVLILRILHTWGSMGAGFFQAKIFLALVLLTNWCTTICITCPILRKIECNEFVCNKFVLVLLQIDINTICIKICIQFE